MCEEDSQTVAEDTESRHRQAVRCPFFVILNQLGIWFYLHVLSGYTDVQAAFVAITASDYSDRNWAGLLAMEPFPNGPDQGVFLPQAERDNPLRTSLCRRDAETFLIE